MSRTGLLVQDKRCLVTGGTHGIGFAVAREMLAEGASFVCVCSRKKESVDAATDKLRREVPHAEVRGAVCNVSDPAALRRMVDDLAQDGKPLDVLVSNVGTDPVSGKALEMTEAVFDKIFSTNVKAAWLLVKLAKPLLVRGSVVLFVSSTGGLQPAYPSTLYGVSKAAVIALTRGLATELSPEGIRVVCVAPGLVKTRMSEAFWKGPYADVARDTLFTRRLGEPEDVARAVSFLVSDKASWVTGETLVVAGGTQTRM